MTLRDTLRDTLAEMLIVPTDKGLLPALVESPVHSSEVDPKQAAIDAIGDAMHDGTWDDERRRRVLERAKQRAESVPRLARTRDSRIERFLRCVDPGALSGLSLDLDVVATLRDRIGRALGTIASSLERSMPWDNTALLHVVSGPEGVVAHWQGNATDLDRPLGPVALVHFERTAELGAAAQLFADTWLTAVQRGADVLPGFQPVATHAGEARYRRTPPTWQDAPAEGTHLASIPDLAALVEAVDTDYARACATPGTVPTVAPAAEGGHQPLPIGTIREFVHHAARVAGCSPSDAKAEIHDLVIKRIAALGGADCPAAAGLLANLQRLDALQL